MTLYCLTITSVERRWRHLLFSPFDICMCILSLFYILCQENIKKFMPPLHLFTRRGFGGGRWASVFCHKSRHQHVKTKPRKTECQTHLMRISLFFFYFFFQVLWSFLQNFCFVFKSYFFFMGNCVRYT